MKIKLTLPWPPMELSQNSRVHRMVKARFTKKARADAYVITKQWMGLAGSSMQMTWREVVESEVKLAFLLDFYPPDRRDHDDDNLIGRFKPSRDGIAQALGINDRKFRTIPNVHDETHLGGKVVVTIAAGQAAIQEALAES